MTTVTEGIRSDSWGRGGDSRRVSSCHTLFHASGSCGCSGASMLPTLCPGDLLLVRYAVAPRPQTLVVADLPPVGRSASSRGQAVDRPRPQRSRPVVARTRQPRIGTDSWLFGSVPTRAVRGRVVADLAAPGAETRHTGIGLGPRPRWARPPEKGTDMFRRLLVRTVSAHCDPPLWDLRPGSGAHRSRVRQRPSRRSRPTTTRTSPARRSSGAAQPLVKGHLWVLWTDTSNLRTSRATPNSTR